MKRKYLDEHMHRTLEEFIWAGTIGVGIDLSNILIEAYPKGTFEAYIDAAKSPASIIAYAATFGLAVAYTYGFHKGMRQKSSKNCSC